MVSPPRFELQGKPGEVIRQIVTIENGGDIAANFAIRTADWDLADDGGVTIHPPELQPGSCRPFHIGPPRSCHPAARQAMAVMSSTDSGMAHASRTR